MAIVINGSGTVTGISVGGLPDGIVDAGTLATNSVDSAELIDGSIDNSHLADNAADTAEIADNAITLAKMAGGTDGNIISYDASGDPVAIATGDDGQVLTSAGAGAPPAFEDAAGSAGIDDQSSSNDDQLTIKDTEIVFNEDGDDLDFRLEGVSNTHCVYFNGDDSKWTFGGSSSVDGTCQIMTAGASSGALRVRKPSGVNKEIMAILNGENIVGSINTNTTATTYNTSSDYRLKENIDYGFDATTRLKQLKPARFNFIYDDTNTLVDGFIAHEVSSIVPEAITGEKDAVNEDGDIQPQGIDQSKLVPLLVKTIQELEARITALEA